MELALEPTDAGLRFVDAYHGSIGLKIAGALGALKKLVSWMPIYGKWAQQKARIDLETEILRSKALNEMKIAFMKAGIPEKFALELAFQRLYQSWPDFYAGGRLAPITNLNVVNVESTGRQLSIDVPGLELAIPTSGREKRKALPPGEAPQPKKDSKSTDRGRRRGGKGPD